MAKKVGKYRVKSAFKTDFYDLGISCTIKYVFIYNSEKIRILNFEWSVESF
jgi:hypothetical protein